jgi:Beta/Gamma crystallin
MPNQIILFKGADFHGPHKHVFDMEPNLNLVATDSQGHVVEAIDNEFYRSVSSVAILSGNWAFFREVDFGGDPSVVLGPGLYRFVGSFKIDNDSVASLRSVQDDPTMPGEPLSGHAILFEHATFHGDHRHVFTDEPALEANDFDKTTSSIVVELGNWSFFSDSQMDGHYPPVLGPGRYPSVDAVGITNDGLSSLQPSMAPATISNSVDNEVILFEHSQFHGAHKHVFGEEPNLNADDDSSFNDQVSSLIVLAGHWSFFSDANFIAPYPILPLAPGVYPSVTEQGITNDDLSSLRPTVPTSVKYGDPLEHHIVLFEHANFRGRHRHIFDAEENLNAADDDTFNDNVSSIVVVSGNWQFFRNWHWDDDYPSILGTGVYPWVGDVGIRNDDMSSLRAVDQDPNVGADPLNAHIVLFEHRDFHGHHIHVVRTELNLNASEDNDFNDAVSSIVVLEGNWSTFGDNDAHRAYPPIVGPGCYPWVEDVGITNDDLTSLQPTDAAATIAAPTPLTSHIMLYQHAKFHGDHKHVFTTEPTLDLVETNANGAVTKNIDIEFNDSVSSIAVLLDQWQTFRDAQFVRPYDVILGGGLYPEVSAVGIMNDDMSSLWAAKPLIQFSGDVTFQIDSALAREPIVKKSHFQFQFFPDTRMINLAQFPDIDLTSGVIAHLASHGMGSLPSNGQMTIPDMVFHIAIPSPGTDSTAQFSLSTGTATSSPLGKFEVTGSPMDSSGNVILVGAGHLAGGSPDNDDFAVQFVGKIAPPPA